VSLQGMAASSIDLRQRLPLPGNADSTHRGPWRPVRVSPTSAEQGLRKPRTTGTIAPEPHAGGQCPRLEGDPWLAPPAGA
jgi:hypothetical protein